MRGGEARGEGGRAVAELTDVVLAPALRRSVHQQGARVVGAGGDRDRCVDRGDVERRRHDGARRRSTDLAKSVEAPADHGAADAHRARVLAPGRYRDRVVEPLHAYGRGLEPPR